MVLPTDGKVVRIVRRDRNLTKMRFEVVDTAPVPLSMEEEFPDPIAQIHEEFKSTMEAMDDGTGSK